MNYKNRKIIEIAQQLGYTTAKEFATFLKIYKPSISTNESGRKFISFSLI
jgi:hypothetical protein